MHWNCKRKQRFRKKLHGGIKFIAKFSLYFQAATLLFFIVHYLLSASYSMHHNENNSSVCAIELEKYFKVTIKCLFSRDYLISYSDFKIDLNLEYILPSKQSLSNQHVAKSFFLAIFAIISTISKAFRKEKVKKSVSDKRYFIRRKKLMRKRNEKVNFYFLVFILYINKRDMQFELPSTEKDFFTTDLLEFSQLTFELNVNYVSLYVYSPVKCYFHRKKGNYLRLILLLGGDIETQPGPAFNYQINNPDLCGYFRAAIFSVLSGINLLSNTADKNISLEDNLDEMKKIFGSQFNANELEFEKLKKIKSKFLKYNADWGRNRHRNNKNDYYDYFATKNWLNLPDKVKCKHSLCCKKCPTASYEMFSKYPTLYDNYLEETKMISEFAEKIVSSKRKSRADCKVLTKNLISVLDKSFKIHFGISFKDSFQKCFNFVSKKSPNEKRTEKRKIIKSAFNSVQKSNESTSVDRLYGTRTSANSWDFQRKQQSFESVPNCLKRTAERNSKIDSGVKKP